MPVFNYKGYDSNAGRDTKGIIDAESAKAARAKLRKTGILPTDLTQEGESKVTLTGDFDLASRFQRVSTEELALTTRQMSTLLSAGIPMVETLVALTDQTENQRLKTTLTAVREHVSGGGSLADALTEHPAIFGELFVNMVRAGETSGALDLVLTRLADFTESQAALQNKVRGAMVYPVILICVAMTVLLFIFTTVIPKIAAILEGQKVALPLITQIMIGLSKFVIGYWWLGLLAVVVALIAIQRYRKTAAGRLFFDRLSLRLPVFGKITRMVAVSRFSRTLSTLLRGGVPMLRAIEIVSAVVANRIFSEAILQTRDFVKEGQSLAEPLKRAGIFPPMITHMISIGEKTGELEKMLEKVSDTYDQQVSTQVSTLTSLLEPILILLMGAVVLIIVLSVILPLLDLTSNVR